MIANFFFRKLEESIKGIIHFTRNTIQFYKIKCDEVDSIEKSKWFVKVLDNYQNYLERLRNNPRISNPNMSEKDYRYDLIFIRHLFVSKFVSFFFLCSQLEKTERKIDKINVIRAIKAILLAKYANNHDRFPDLQEMRTSVRANLTKEDFVEKWDVGFRQ